MARSDIGVASHITAAAAGGKRFDPSLTSEQRSSIENGIWLCQICGKKVDDDEETYTVKVLRARKREAEQTAADSLGVSQKLSQESITGSPLERMIAHHLRDTITFARFPFEALLAQVAPPDGHYALQRVLSSHPRNAAGSELPDRAPIQPLLNVLLGPHLLECCSGPLAPTSMRWIDWIVAGLNSCSQQCQQGLDRYAARGPSTLIAQFEELGRSTSNVGWLLQIMAQRQQAELIGSVGRSHIEIVILHILKAERIWIEFLEVWVQRQQR